MDFGNLVAAAFVFGQFITERKFSLELFMLGIILTLSCYSISLIVSQ